MPAAVRPALFGQSAVLQNAGVKPEDAAGTAVKPANPKKISGIGIFARGCIFKHAATHSESKLPATQKAPLPKAINGKLFT